MYKKYFLNESKKEYVVEMILTGNIKKEMERIVKAPPPYSDTEMVAYFLNTILRVVFSICVQCRDIVKYMT